MREALLIAAAGAVFLFGWFLMGRLDGFLNRLRRERTEEPADRITLLRVGLSDPLTADGLSEVLRTFAEAHPDVVVRLLSGNGEELLSGLAEERLDVVFLPESVPVPRGCRVGIHPVVLERASVLAQRCGLQIGPAAENSAPQRLVWREDADRQETYGLIACLREGFEPCYPKK